MTGLFYFILFLLVLFVLVFVAYYGWRLWSLRGSRDESSRRMQALMMEVHSLPGGARADQPVVPAVAGAPGAGIAGVVVQTGGGATTPPPDAAGAATRVYQRKVALRMLSPVPVFLKRDKAGEVTVQIESRAPMPLKYVLDPRARQMLQEVASVASVELGDRWSVLAAEDDDGQLTLTQVF